MLACLFVCELVCLIGGAPPTLAYFTYHAQIFEKHKDKITQYLQGNQTSEQKETGKVTKQEIIEAIVCIEIPEFTEPIKDYYFLKLFERSNTIAYYYIKDVSDIFKPKLELKSISQSPYSPC